MYGGREGLTVCRWEFMRCTKVDLPAPAIPIVMMTLGFLGWELQELVEALIVRVICSSSRGGRADSERFGKSRDGGQEETSDSPTARTINGKALHQYTQQLLIGYAKKKRCPCNKN